MAAEKRAEAVGRGQGALAQDAEREERALLMENLTKTRDEMKYLLNALDAVKDDEEGGATNTALSRNSSGHEIIDQMCLLESVTKAGAGAGSDGGLAPAWEASRLSYRTNRKTWAGRAPLFLLPPVVEAL